MQIKGGFPEEHMEERGGGVNACMMLGKWDSIIAADMSAAVCTLHGVTRKSLYVLVLSWTRLFFTDVLMASSHIL